MQGTRPTRAIKIIVISVAVFIQLAVMCLVVYGFTSTGGQIAPAEANTMCQDFFQDVKSQITDIPGYAAINGVKHCTPQQDEAGGMDYIISVTFRVSKDTPDSIASLKADMDYLAKTLPQKNYAVFVDNVPARHGQPETMCVSASRYIDNDGKDYPQGPPDHHSRYTEPGSIEGFEPCKGL